MPDSPQGAIDPTDDLVARLNDAVRPQPQAEAFDVHPAAAEPAGGTADGPIPQTIFDAETLRWQVLESDGATHAISAGELTGRINEETGGNAQWYEGMPVDPGFHAADVPPVEATPVDIGSHDTPGDGHAAGTHGTDHSTDTPGE